MILLELVLALIASLRGWKFIPWVLVLVSISFGFILGFLGVLPRLAGLANALDLGLICMFVVMALVGRRPARSQPSLDLPSIQCPNCGQHNLVEAKTCRYCGQPLRKSLFSRTTRK